MPTQMEMTWNELMTFRMQPGMPVFHSNIRIGRKSSFIDTTIDQLTIQEQAELTHSWLMENGTLYERIAFEDELAFRTSTPINEEEKKEFLNAWFALKNPIHWGMLNGNRDEMNADTMGWALSDDINEFVMKEKLEKEGEELWLSGGRYGEHMSQRFHFKVNEKKSPTLCLFVLTGGIYYMEMEPVKMLFEDRRLNEKEEKDQLQRLNSLAGKINTFLQQHTVTIDATRGVIKIDEDEESEE